MSKPKYKILWLDDFFVPIHEDGREDQKESIEIFLDDISDAEDEGLSVKGVSSFEEFKAELPNINAYHGVVFDLRGMTKNGEVTDQVVHDAINLIKSSNNDIPMYVYSSNAAMSKFELTINDIKKNGRAFSKGKDPEDLIKKIISDMDNLYNFYVGHEECRDLFHEDFLDSTLKPVMDQIVKRYSDPSLKFNPYNPMRLILENMLQKLNDIGIIKVDNNSKDTFNLRVRYLCEFYNPKLDADNNVIIDSEGKIVRNFHDPVVPFDMINQETKYLICFLGDMTNHNSHFITKHLDSDMGSYYDRNVFNATFCAFFAVMKWYYLFMHERSLYIV